jgi:hypothetical protein
MWIPHLPTIFISWWRQEAHYPQQGRARAQPPPRSAPLGPRARPALMRRAVLQAAHSAPSRPKPWCPASKSPSAHVLAWAALWSSSCASRLSATSSPSPRRPTPVVAHSEGGAWRSTSAAHNNTLIPPGSRKKMPPQGQTPGSRTPCCAAACCLSSAKPCFDPPPPDSWPSLRPATPPGSRVG